MSSRSYVKANIATKMTKISKKAHMDKYSPSSMHRAKQLLIDPRGGPYWGKKSGHFQKLTSPNFLGAGGDVIPFTRPKMAQNQRAFSALTQYSSSGCAHATVQLRSCPTPGLADWPPPSARKDRQKW